MEQVIEKIFSLNDLENAFKAGRTVESYKGESLATYRDDYTSPKYPEFIDFYKNYQPNMLKDNQIVKLYSQEEVISLLLKCCAETSCEDGSLFGKQPSELYLWIKNELV